MVTVPSNAALPVPVSSTWHAGLVPQLWSYLPRGNLLDARAWRQRHTMLQWLLSLHAPGLFLFGLWRDFSPLTCALVILPLLVLLAAAAVVRQRRPASFFTTAGLVYCSSALVGLSGGSIEAHFHFFILIGFIALYQDWVPFMWNIVFTVLSHGIGSAWSSTLIFNTVSGQTSPWAWSMVHGLAVLAACVGMVIFWRTSEDEQQKALALSQQLSAAEINQRRFTAELLVNLARRNQGMLYRQLDILNQLENQEQDPDALADLFRLDHLATRIRRNAESLLVLSGEDPPRVWSEPVRLLDVVRAAIAETEDLERVVFDLDEHLAVLGHTVTGLTHLLAELTENAVRSSPPHLNVTIRTRPDPRVPGSYVLTVEDWGLGMPPHVMVEANDVLAEPREVDLSASQRLGFHVVSRLAHRLGIRVWLTPTADSGVTAVVTLPAGLFPPGPQWGPGTTSARTPSGVHGPGLPRRVPQATRTGADVSASAVPEPAASAVPEPAASAVPDPAASAVTDPAASAVTDPAASAVPEPAATAGTDPAATAVTDPAASAVTDPAASAVPEPAPSAVTEPPQAPQWPGRPPVPAYVADPAAPSTPPMATGWPGRPPAPPYSPEPTRPASAGEPSPVFGGRPWPGQVAAAEPPNLASASAEPAAPAQHGSPPGDPQPPGAKGSTPASGVVLSRRTPQTHLAPQLRASSVAAVASAVPDPERTRDALSRYQASRQEALSKGTVAAGHGVGLDDAGQPL